MELVLQSLVALAALIAIWKDVPISSMSVKIFASIVVLTMTVVAGWVNVANRRESQP